MSRGCDFESTADREIIFARCSDARRRMRDCGLFGKWVKKLTTSTRYLGGFVSQLSDHMGSTKDTFVNKRLPLQHVAVHSPKQRESVCRIVAIEPPASNS